MSLSTSSVEKKSASQSYQSIQGMRGVAAILVLLFHCGVIMAQPHYGGLRPSFYSMTIGWTGVNFFFVLSGFIILHAHSKDIGQPERISVYLWKRFSRVYPIYWIILTAFVTASFAGLGHAEFSTSTENFLTAYTLFQFEKLPTLPLKVAWTLLYEIQFYAIFAFAIVSRKLGVAVMAVWLSVVVASAFTFHPPEGGFPNIWSANFFLGAAAYYGVSKLPRQLDKIAGAVSLALGTLMGLMLIVKESVPSSPDLAQNRPISFLLIGISFMLILAGGVLLERASGFRLPKVFSKLGDASYSIYLVHSAAISVLSQIFHKLHIMQGSPGILFVVLALFATAGGLATHYVIEKPLMHAFRQNPFRRRSGADVPTRLAFPTTAPTN